MTKNNHLWIPLTGQAGINKFKIIQSNVTAKICRTVKVIYYLVKICRVAASVIVCVSSRRQANNFQRIVRIYLVEFDVVLRLV